MLQKEEDVLIDILFFLIRKDRAGLFVEFLLAQVLHIDGFLSTFPVDNRRFREFLAFAKFFHDTGLFEFSFEFLEGSLDVFTFFNRNYDHV